MGAPRLQHWLACGLAAFVLPLVACGSDSASPVKSISTEPSPTSPAPPPDAAAPSKSSPGYACVSTFPAPPKITLPADEARHGDFFEWWYWTGHLETADGRPFGFQVTFFESTPNKSVSLVSATMAHFTITDEKAGRFAHDYRFSLPGSYPQLKDRFRAENDTWWAEGTGGSYSMHADMDGYALDLTLEDQKRAVFHFENGLTGYPPPYEGYTYYGSRPRLAASGTITVGQTKLAVKGEAWMDQQWGQPPQRPALFPLPPVVEMRYGWSWFQFQLEGGEELMLLRMHVKDGEDGSFLAGGTFVDKDCSFESLAPEAIQIETLDWWTSPHTGRVYPQNWRVHVPSKGLSLDATVVLADQELYKHHQGNPITWIATPPYWEGKISVSGTGPHGPVRGHGYAESVGTIANDVAPDP